MEAIVIRGQRIQVLHRASADTDYGFGYLEGRPVVLSSDCVGFAEVPEGGAILNNYNGFVFYVEDGKWCESHNSYHAWKRSELTDPDSLDWTWEPEDEEEEE